jgi:hypothetical protein
VLPPLLLFCMAMPLYVPSKAFVVFAGDPPTRVVPGSAANHASELAHADSASERPIMTECFIESLLAKLGSGSGVGRPLCRRCLSGILEFFVTREPDRVGRSGEEGREDFVLPHHPCLRIFSGWTRDFQATPEFFPRFPAFKYPNSTIRIPPRPFNTLQEIMVDEAREGEKAAPLRVPDSALEGS